MDKSIFNIIYKVLRRTQILFLVIIEYDSMEALMIKDTKRSM